jgi:hypothetical protein
MSIIAIKVDKNNQVLFKIRHMVKNRVTVNNGNERERNMRAAKAGQK